MATRQDADRDSADGRPTRLSARTDKAILDATTELLREVGVRGLTVDGVAARSGVGKASIYRRYRDKGELALTIVLGWLEGVPPPRNLGDTRKELTRFANTAVELLGSPFFRDIVHGLVSELSNPELARAYRERVIEPWVAGLQTIIDRGVERGDLQRGTDARRALELMVGPIYFRLLFSGAPLDKKLGARCAVAVMSTFAPDRS
jgi:AcrR family transcriptional regulator